MLLRCALSALFPYTTLFRSEVDVHAFVFDETGNGVYRMSNGEDWVFPAPGFAGRGQILGFNVRCLSPEVQVLCHAQDRKSTRLNSSHLVISYAVFRLKKKKK